MTFQSFAKQCGALAGDHARLLETPGKGIDADLALPCFALAKEMRKNPAEIAKELAIGMKPSGLIAKVESQGPYVNFYADWNRLGKEIVGSIAKNGERYGSGKMKEKVIVEFAHPNTHKLFHIGHLRNITTGESVARILEFAGAKVIRANYQGDVGLHIAKCLYGINKLGMKRPASLDEKIRFLGEAYAKGSGLYEEDEKAKEEIIGINRKLYEKDRGIMKLWKETRKWSLEYFSRIYRRVYTKFDRLYFESEVAERGLMLSRKALKKGILKKSDGAVIFDGSGYGMEKRVFINNIGFPTYEAKELGLAELEFSESNPNMCVHVVGPEQSSFFKVTFKVEELIDPKKFKGRQFHLVYGWVTLREGKMSSRLGHVIEGEWLLDELKKTVMEQYLSKQGYTEKEKTEIAETIAVAAAKYYMLKIDTVKDIAFDTKAAVDLEGDTGPYIQYTYARAKSILRKSGKKPAIKHGFEKDEIGIIKALSRFPLVAGKCAEELKPNHLANYLFSLATQFNEFYHAKPVIGSEREETMLALVAAAAAVIKSGLKLLGIDALEKM